MSSSSSPPVSPASGKHTVLDDGLSLNNAMAFLSEKTRQADVHVLSPLRSVFKDAFNNYPTATSYFMIFCALSSLPVMCFVGFSLFASSALLAISLVFVLSWGAVILGSALFTLLVSLGFLAIATFWIVLGLFLTIFILRIIYNIQAIFVQKLSDMQAVRGITEHLHDLRLQKQQEEEHENDPDRAMAALADQSDVS